MNRNATKPRDGMIRHFSVGERVHLCGRHDLGRSCACCERKFYSKHWEIVTVIESLGFRTRPDGEYRDRWYAVRTDAGDRLEIDSGQIAGWSDDALADMFPGR